MAKRSAHSVDVLVGQNIRITRLRRGLSQAALAEQVGITFQQIQKYERGDNRVGASRLLQIADALQVPLPTLFEGLPTAGQTAQPEDSSRRFLVDGRAMRLAQAFDKISEEEMRLAVVHLIEAIVEARARQR